VSGHRRGQRCATCVGAVVTAVTSELRMHTYCVRRVSRKVVLQHAASGAAFAVCSLALGLRRNVA
jgi:hypothetical protein